MEFMTCLYPHSRVAVCSKNVLFDLSRLNVLRIVSDYLLRMFAAMFYDRAGGGSCGGLVTDGSRILVTAEKTGTPSHLDPRHHGYSVCKFDEYIEYACNIFREGIYWHLFRVKSASAFTCMFCKLASDPILQVKTACLIAICRHIPILSRSQHYRINVKIE